MRDPAAMPAFRPVIRSLRGVVAGGHPLTCAAGLRLLQQGGNAVDAAMAMILAASVVENDHFAFGGQCPILIYAAQNRSVTAINGIGTAPRLTDPEFFALRGEFPAGILRATIPPMPGAVVAALDLFGSRSFSEVAGPAIEYADGFPLGEYLHRTFREWEKRGLIREPTTLKLMKPDGRAPQPGEVFAQPDLARTLRTLAGAEQASLRQGRHAGLTAVWLEFYRGSIAEEIVRFHLENQGLHRLDDYAHFQTQVMEGLSVSYREYQIFKHGPWTQGPALLQMLNLLEGYDLASLGHNSADYAHLLIETMKLALSDRDHYYGDPDFAVIPLQGLLSKEYAAARRTEIRLPAANLEEHLQGDPYRYQEGPGGGSGDPVPGSASPPLQGEGAEETTCINVADRFGNLVSVTPSGPTGWTAPVMGQTGILMNTRMQQFLLDDSLNPANRVAPGKRPRTTLTPTIVLKQGQPFLALSTPGTELQEQSLLQVFLNLVEFGMNPQQAVEAPRLDIQHLFPSGGTRLIKKGGVNVEGRFEPRVVEELRARGHRVTVIPDYGNQTGVTVVMFDARRSSLAAGADVRRDRYALGW